MDLGFEVSILSHPRLEILPGLWLDARLALWLEASRILVVADLHWGFAESHRIRGNLLPAWGDADIANRLCSLLADYQPEEMIWLGDSLHTVAGRTAAEEFLNAAEIPIAIVGGNHDRRWSRAAELTSLRRGNLVLHHGDRDLPVTAATIEVVGHYHPAVSWGDGAGTRLKLPALVKSPRKIIMPAFSPWAAGTPWKAKPDETLYAIGTKRIFTVSGDIPQKEPLAR
jgi:metallophosphoesterase superfamily enzyme